MQEAPDLTAALAAAQVVIARFHTASDDELLADLNLVEQLGRIADGLRIRAAAEVEARSRKILGQGSLAFRSGARDGTELVQAAARIDHRTAKARIGLGTTLAPGVSLDGSLLPGTLPTIRAAVETGQIGIETARVIVDAVREVRPRASAADLDAMVEGLLTTARTADTEVLREAAADWIAAVDPDGAEPREAAQHRRRAVRLGRTLSDGTTRMSVVLPPEHLAIIKELLASRRRSIPMIRIEAGDDAADETLGPGWRPDDADDRTTPQQDFDTLLDAITAGMDAEHASGAVTHEVVVTVTADQLEHRRAHGRCEFPGCRVPAPFLEAHHVAWWHRDSGPTDVGNGVMLCSFHHHLIHAKQSRIEIQTHTGRHRFVPTGRTGPPPPPPPPAPPPENPWHR